ncbi:MAG: ArsR family transcriptional regulator, partial [Bacillota bacterium]
MAKEVVQVPASLLLCPGLPASAKLVWMISCLRPASDQAGTAWLSDASGLSRPTVLKAMSVLTAAGWDLAGTGSPTGASVAVPVSLLTNRRLGITTRVLYGILLLTPGFSHPSGQFTYAELAALAHASRNTVAGAVDELARAEWIKVERANRLARVRFELTFPGLNWGMTAIAEAERRLEKVRYFGEWLMREYLSLLVDSEDYEDDATPGFLVNPRTGERLQLDRFYPPAVAFEYNGPQHYRATARFSADEVA